MFVFKFIVLVSIIAGSYCMSVGCFRQAEIECIDYKMKPIFPRTVEDVIDFCTKIIPLGYCHIGVMEKCAKNETFWDNDEHVERFKEEVKFIETSCDEDSPIFKVITDNLNCVVSNFIRMNNICYWSLVDETVGQRIEDLVVEEPEGCVIDAWTFYCKTAEIDLKCGNEARDAVAEILDIVYSSPACREVRQGLSYFETAFKSQYRRGNYGEDAVNGVFEVIRQEEA